MTLAFCEARVNLRPPQAGFEPAARWLTAICSTTELLKSIELKTIKKAEDGIEPSLSDLQSHTLAIMLPNLIREIKQFSWFSPAALSAVLLRESFRVFFLRGAKQRPFLRNNYIGAEHHAKKPLFTKEQG